VAAQRGVEAGRKAKRGDMAGGVRELAGATGRLLRFGFGKALQGAVGDLIIQTAVGGTLGLKMRLHRWADDPMEMVGESLLFATVSGPYGAVLRAMDDSDNFLEQLSNAALPVVLAKEIGGALLGEGREYEGRSLGENVATLFKRFLPAIRTVDTGLVAVGLNDPRSHAMRTAVNGYWRWRMKSLPRTSTRRAEADDGDAAAQLAQESYERFRLATRRAYEAISKYEDEDVVEGWVREALDVEGKEPHHVARAIRSRMLLGDEAVQDRMDDLRGQVGPEALHLLEVHDDILDGWARSVEAGGGE